MKKRQRFLNILYIDKDILVVDKPTGVLSEPKRDSEFPDIVAMAKGYLQRRYKTSKSSFLKPIHRLDRETTGVLTLALSKIGENLVDDFREHKIHKHYVAIVEGALETGEGKIDFDLEKGEFAGGRKTRVVQKGKGKKAKTLYRVKERYPNATLLDVEVLTGRTHQIRAHFEEIGHPLVGDKTYGACKIAFRRQALHAESLSFQHPRTGKKMRFQAKLPKDLQELIDQLRGE